MLTGVSVCLCVSVRPPRSGCTTSCCSRTAAGWRTVPRRLPVRLWTGPGEPQRQRELAQLRRLYVPQTVCVLHTVLTESGRLQEAARLADLVAGDQYQLYKVRVTWPETCNHIDVTLYSFSKVRLLVLRPPWAPYDIFSRRALKPQYHRSFVLSTHVHGS